jgi:hypothetical protein
MNEMCDHECREEEREGWERKSVGSREIKVGSMTWSFKD